MWLIYSFIDIQIYKYIVVSIFYPDWFAIPENIQHATLVTFIPLWYEIPRQLKWYTPLGFEYEWTGALFARMFHLYMSNTHKYKTIFQPYSIDSVVVH